jgi:hypothetical protein
MLLHEGGGIGRNEGFRKEYFGMLVWAELLSKSRWNECAVYTSATMNVALHLILRLLNTLERLKAKVSK